MNGKLSKEQFFAKIRNVEKATSINCVHDSDICLIRNMITNMCDTTKKTSRVNADNFPRLIQNVLF